MSLWKAIVLVNLALAVGVLAGYLWWAGEVARLRREVDRPRPATSGAAHRDLVVQGIVREASTARGTVLVTHGPLPGLAGAVTSEFRLDDGALLAGLEPGDAGEMTVGRTGDGYELTVLRRVSPRARQ